MAIKKKIESDQDKKHASFIDKGSDVAADKEKKIEFISILVRAPVDLLKDIDALLKKRPWTSRTQWIVETLHKKLIEEKENE